ncbi:MAG TPA: T9SS type A sorting domain-containing protein [bacterium]|nr:T9SS type A sorting domain-containing protein [bacterium]
MKKLLSLIILLFALTGGALADYSISNTTGVTPLVGQTAVGQSFTTLTAGTVTAIKINGNIGSSVSLTLRIYAGESVGVPLYTQSVTRSGSGVRTHTFTLTTPFPVTANTGYTFTVTGSGSFQAFATLLNLYGGGHAYYTSFGSTGFQSSVDLIFTVDVAALPNYTVSGYVTHAGLPISGATLTFSHDGGTVTTDLLGYYSRSLVSGTTTTITPSKEGYASFSPATRTLTNLSGEQSGQNFAGSLATYTISGRVNDGTHPIPGVTLTFSVDLGTATTDANGEYSYTVYHGTTTLITPSHPGYHGWNPGTRLLTNVTGNQSGQDFTGEINMYVVTGIISSGITPLPGATVTFSYNGSTATAGALGIYSATVPYGTTTTITPSMPGYGNWTPASRTLTSISENYMLQNFSGTIVPLTISGKVTDGTNPLAGVTLTFSHNGGTATTNSSGEYTYTVDYGTSTTITPSHPGYHGWTPAAITLTSIATDQPNQDFTGIINTYTLSGKVTDGTNPISGVSLTFSHNSGTTTTNTAGEYTCIVNYGTTTTITPSHPGYHGWAPAAITLTSIAVDQPNQDFAGVINTYTLSGTVGDGSKPVAGATLTFSHNGATASTDAAGAWSCVVNYNTTTTITPSHPGYSIWDPAEIALTQIAADQPNLDFNAQPSRMMVAIQFKDEAGLPVGDVTCRVRIPGLSEWEAISMPVMHLLWGQHPYNALFRSWDMAMGGQYTFKFTAPEGYAFTGPDALVLDVPAAENFYSVDGHIYILRKTSTVPVDTTSLALPEPVVDRHPLVFVSGSPAWDAESWPNVVDEDLEGWDGTGTVKADVSGAAWAIFRFRDGKTVKFNYFTLQTDNGVEDDLYADRQAVKVEVLASNSGMAPEDFNSLGIYRVKTPEMALYKIGQRVVAKYVMLRIFAIPGAKHNWEQVVEFGVSWNKQPGTVLASEELDIAAVPGSFTLEPSYPNPFNPETTIRYQLPEEMAVRLSIYNLFGQEVVRLVDGEEAAGAHALRWNAEGMPSGIYLVRLTAGGETAMQRITLLK